ITKRGREILIPVVAEPSIPLARHGARWETGERLPSRSLSRNPRDRLDERLRAAGIPLAIAPRRWKRLGDVLILRILPEAQAHARALAEIYGSVLGARTVVQDVSGIHGPLRLPDFEVLWGYGTETVYLEGGVRYAFDVAFAALRTKGTIVYHELCPKEQFPDALARRLGAATRANWRNVVQMHTRIVKSYAPGIVHAVAEFEVSPLHRM